MVMHMHLSLFKCVWELCLYASFMDHCMSFIFVHSEPPSQHILPLILACIKSVWGWFRHLSIALHVYRVLHFTSFSVWVFNNALHECLHASESFWDHLVCHFRARMYAIVCHVSSLPCSWRVASCALGSGPLHCACLHEFRCLVCIILATDFGMLESYPC